MRRDPSASFEPKRNVTEDYQPAEPTVSKEKEQKVDNITEMRQEDKQ